MNGNKEILMSQNKCTFPGCNALVIAGRTRCSRHKGASKPCEITGQVDSKSFARAMADTRQERTRLNNLAVEKQNREAAEKAAAFMSTKPLATVAEALAAELREEFVAAIPVSEGRLPTGKFAPRAQKYAAKATVAKLRELGFGG